MSQCLHISSLQYSSDDLVLYDLPVDTAQQVNFAPKPSLDYLSRLLLLPLPTHASLPFLLVQLVSLLFP